MQITNMHHPNNMLKDDPPQVATYLGGLEILTRKNMRMFSLFSLLDVLK